MRKITDANEALLERLYRWSETLSGFQPALGMSTEQALAAAITLRRRIPDLRAGELAFTDRDATADVLHALCILMADEFQSSPQEVLAGAATVYEALEETHWEGDEFGERHSLLCCFAFLCWRGARVLGRSGDVQKWEVRYRFALLESIEWSVLEDNCQEQHGDAGGPFARLEELSSEELFQLLFYLRERCDTNPQMVSVGAARLYFELSTGAILVPADLRLFLLGESARLAGATVRNTGAQEDASKWLEIAAGHFDAEPNGERDLARVSYLRYTILYSLCQFEAVHSSISTLAKTFSDLGMEEDLVKCRILWAASLKSAGECERALAVLAPLRGWKPRVRPALYGWVLVELGDISQILGHYERAFEDLKAAGQLFQAEGQLTGLADVAAMMGFGYRSQGMLKEAAECFQASREEYRQLGMQSLEAYASILLAETYLASGAPRDAERLLIAAVPIFERHGMVADAVAAVGLLRESLRRQRLDPQMLRAMREHLRGGNR